MGEFSKEITDYVLDEMSSDERVEFEKRLKVEPGLLEQVNLFRATSEALKLELSKEKSPELSKKQRSKIKVQTRTWIERIFGSTTRVAGVAVASIAVIFITGKVVTQHSQQIIDSTNSKTENSRQQDWDEISEGVPNLKPAAVPLKGSAGKGALSFSDKSQARRALKAPMELSKDSVGSVSMESNREVVSGAAPARMVAPSARLRVREKETLPERQQLAEELARESVKPGSVQSFGAAEPQPMAAESDMASTPSHELSMRFLRENSKLPTGLTYLEGVMVMNTRVADCYKGEKKSPESKTAPACPSSWTPVRVPTHKASNLGDINQQVAGIYTNKLRRCSVMSTSKLKRFPAESPDFTKFDKDIRFLKTQRRDCPVKILTFWRHNCPEGSDLRYCKSQENCSRCQQLEFKAEIINP